VHGPLDAPPPMGPRQVVLAQQQELARLVAEFEATQARSEAALAALARGDPAGRLAEAQVVPRACKGHAQKPCCSHAA